MSMIRTPVLIGVIVFGASLGFAPAASATIHPIVESYDCANATAHANHPLGDVADPLGVTPGQTHSDQSTFRSLIATGEDSPAWFGHKLDGECGHAGP